MRDLLLLAPVVVGHFVAPVYRLAWLLFTSRDDP
jgi:hypothetical protein